MSEAAVKQIVLASRPKGLPTHENFRLQDVPMPELPPGGLLLRVAAAWTTASHTRSRSASAR